MGKDNTMKVTALTCTGDRPVCLKLLSQWMKNQTLQPDQWLVIDDGKEPFIPSMDCDYVYRKPQPSDPSQTLNVNLEFAIPYIKGDIILFCEDDEYFSPNYVKTMVEKIQGHDAVGICRSKYYHLPTRTYHVHGNQDHASLAQTGISSNYLPKFKTLLDGDPFIDIRVWEDIGAKKQGLKWSGAPFSPRGMSINGGRGFLFDDGMKDCLYVGMKGMPGRPGIGSGHKGIGRPDPQGVILHQWMPKDYQIYLDLKLENRLQRRIA